MSAGAVGTALVLRHGRTVVVALMLSLLVGLPAAGILRVRPAWMVTGAITGFVLVAVLSFWMQWQRERVVREGALPQFLKRKLRQQYPQLAQKDAELVERGLRQFFLACLRSRGAFVAMPSQAADAMWHEFILHTQAYRDWCALALGRFLHHTPAEVLGRDPKRNDGLRRAWYWACKDEAIDPRQPTRLPLLFALDAKLGIAGGFTYVPDCRGLRDEDATTQCGTAFADGSSSGASGDADGFGGCDAGGADGGDGGGDGGCGGGGD